MNGAKQSMIRNSVFNVIKTIGTFLFPVINFSYISRIFGTDGMGRINFARSIVGIFAMISMLGIRYYGIRECAKKRDDKEALSRIFCELLLLNLIFTLLSYVLLFVYLHMSVKTDGYKAEIGLYCFTILLGVISVEWLFTAVEDYLYLAKRSIVIQLFSLLAVLLLVRKKEDLYLYIIIQVVTSCVVNCSGLIYIKRYLSFTRPRMAGLAVHLRPILKLFLITMFVQVFTEMDTVMLGYLSSDTQVGLYSSAYKLSVVLCSFISSVTTVIMPRMAYLFQNEDKSKADELLKNAVQFILLVGIPLSAGACIYSRHFILLLSGEGFEGAVPASMLLSLRTLLSPVNGMLLMHYMVPRNKEREAVIVTAVTAVFNVSLNLLLIPLLGATGAAISTVGSEMTEMICIMAAVRKYLDIKNVFEKMYQYLVCVIPVVAAAFLAGQYIRNTVLSVVIGVVAAAPVYFILLYNMKNRYFLRGMTVIREMLKRKVQG